MPKNTQPPLIWLRAFEATGRLGSFKDAAATLNVSPSTVSHQVRDLEQFFGVPLFNRSARSAELTSEGQRLLPPLTNAFEMIGSATEQVFLESDQLKIGGFPFLIHEILTPNVTALKQALAISRLSLLVETDKNLLMASNTDQRLDVLVRYTSDIEPPGLWSEKLFDISLVPIVSSEAPEIKHIDDLLNQPIIKVLSPLDAWEMWRTGCGAPLSQQNIAMETDSYHAAVMAVEKNQGICLGILPFLNPWLKEGKVKAIEKYRVDTGQSACLVTAQHNKDNPLVKKLAGWFRSHLT